MKKLWDEAGGYLVVAVIFYLLGTWMAFAYFPAVIRFVAGQAFVAAQGQVEDLQGQLKQYDRALREEREKVVALQAEAEAGKDEG